MMNVWLSMLWLVKPVNIFLVKRWGIGLIVFFLQNYSQVQFLVQILKLFLDSFIELSKQTSNGVNRLLQTGVLVITFWILIRLQLMEV